VTVISLLEIQDRKGTAMVRAMGFTAIVAAVAIHLIRWAAIVLLAQLGGPLLP
jgi:hypothetical protein